MTVKSYPDFLEKEEEETYESQSILGILYRDVKERILAPIIEDKTAKSGAPELFDDDLSSFQSKRHFTI